MRQTWRMMLARFPYGGSERTELIDWTAAAVSWAARQADLDGGLLLWKVNDTPVTMCRNLAVKAAIHNGIDILVMVDSDMAPDIDRDNPFLPEAFEFIKGRWHEAPTVIAAPYCTGAPAYSLTMGRWRTYAEGLRVKASLYTREEALAMQGIQPCSLMGTGLIAIDMRVFTGFPVGDELVKLSPPWFFYEFTDEEHTTKASTEDMVFTRNLSLVFAKHDLTVGYVNWDAWAYHVKTEFVGKPFEMTIKTVAPLHRE